VRDAGVVPLRVLVDLLADVLRQRDLRGAEPVAGRRGVVERGVHLEVYVRPAAVVRRREDARELERARLVRLLHAAQEVLVRDVLGVHRVLALAAAVPQVDRRPGVGRDVLTAHVVDLEPYGQRHALGGARGVPEAAGDVGPHHPALAERVRTVGPVAGERAGGLLGDLPVRDGGVRLRGGPTLAVGAGRRRRAVVGAAGRHGDRRTDTTEDG